MRRINCHRADEQIQGSSQGHQQPGVCREQSQEPPLLDPQINGEMPKPSLSLPIPSLPLKQPSLIFSCLFQLPNPSQPPTPSSPGQGHLAPWRLLTFAGSHSKARKSGNGLWKCGHSSLDAPDQCFHLDLNLFGHGLSQVFH